MKDEVICHCEKFEDFVGPPTREEVMEYLQMEEWYKEWSKQLDAAIESGDEALIEELWDMGK